MEAVVKKRFKKGKSAFIPQAPDKLGEIGHPRVSSGGFSPAASLHARDQQYQISV